MIALMHHHMGAAEIAALFGVSRQRVQQLVGRPDFPAPESVLAMGKVWRTEDVHRWGREHGRLGGHAEAAIEAKPATTAPEVVGPDLIELVAGLDRLRIGRAIKHLRAVRKGWFGQAWQETADLSGEIQERAIVTMAVKAKLLTAKDLGAF
jgi:hypothetical protein